MLRPMAALDMAIAQMSGLVDDRCSLLCSGAL